METNRSKIVYYGEVLIDLTADTVSEENLLSGATAHDKSGATITGKCTFDSDTQDATAAAAEILKGKTVYARGAKITGTMPNNASVKKTITEKAGVANIPQGYHDGSGGVQIDSAEQEKITPANIREGVTILGVVGSMSGTEGANPQTKEITPTNAAQTILPDTKDGYNYLAQVTVKAVPYVETENSAGGENGHDWWLM